MSNIKKYLNEDNIKLNKKDYITILIIVFIYGIISFINLGSNVSPNTFFYSKLDDEIVFQFDKSYDFDKIVYFNGNYGSKYKIYVSEDGYQYNEVYNLHDNSSFAWKEEYINTYGKYVKFVFADNSSIGELRFYDNINVVKYINVLDSNNNYVTTINDEDYTIPKKISYMNSSYFDEVYFARTAYEYVYNIPIYEWTHPPLGKLIQAIPLFITHHLSPFNYRLMGNISGILMLVIMYLFGKELFKKRKFAALSSIIMALDTFHFAHTRMGTVDSHLVLFIIITSYFMIRFINTDKIRYLFLSGLFFALSISVKWIGLYNGVALAIIYFIYMFKKKKFNIKYISYGFSFFVFIPLIIYCSIYLLFPNNLYNTDSIGNIIEVQESMYNYHSKLNDDHFFSSKWYTWPISYKPVWYYHSDNGDYSSSITGVGNLVIWIVGVIAVIYSIVMLLFSRKKDINSMILLLFIISLYCPNIFINRIMFLYHYFSVLPFIMLITVNMFYNFDKKKRFQLLLPVYLVLSLFFFIIYYPVVSGLFVPSSYADKLEIFDEWYF